MRSDYSVKAEAAPGQTIFMRILTAPIRSSTRFSPMLSTDRWLFLAGSLAIGGALIHVAAVFAGPSSYFFFHAPPSVVASARTGTWLAPISALAIAAAMGLCAAYAFSAAGFLPRLPLLRAGLAAIAIVCSVRGLLLVPLYLLRPQLVDTFGVLSAVVWFLAGMGFAVGFGARARKT